VIIRSQLRGIRNEEESVMYKGKMYNESKCHVLSNQKKTEKELDATRFG